MKKCLAFVLAVMMILTFCTACGQQSSKKSNVPTLTWYVPGDNQADLPLINEELSKITEKEIGCKVEIQFIDNGSFQERMNMNMASGSDYDLAFVGYLNTFTAAASMNGLMPLDELLTTTPDLMKEIPEYIMNFGKYEGTMYAIPNMQITASATAACVPKDFADEFKADTGIDVSTFTCTTDYEPYLAWIKENKPGVYPIQTNWGMGGFTSVDRGEDAADPFYRTVIPASAYDLVKDPENKTFKAVCGFATEESNAKLYAEKYHEYYKKGWVRSDVDTVLDETPDRKAKKYGLWFAVYKPGMDAEATANYGYETLSTMISPVSIGSATSTMIGIGRNCKYPDKAIKVIELMNTNVEAYNLVCFGIEGKHYKMVGEERIEYIENSGYKPNASWKFGNQFNAYRLPGQDDDVWEQTIAFNDLGYQESLKNPNLASLGFSVNTENIQIELTKVKEVLDKYKCREKGSKDPDTYWDKMVDELYKAGLQVVLDEYQRQFDEYFAANPGLLDKVQW